LTIKEKAETNQAVKPRLKKNLDWGHFHSEKLAESGQSPVSNGYVYVVSR
jgi:hypothetical protein